MQFSFSLNRLSNFVTCLFFVRKYQCLTMFVFIGMMLSGSVAYSIGDAAPLDINHFHPALGSGKFLTVDTGQVGSTAEDVPSSGARPEFGVQHFMHYAYRPLVLVYGNRHVLEDGTVLPDIVKHRLTSDIAISLALWRRFQIGLSLPMTLYQSGEPVSTRYLQKYDPLPDLVPFGFGDLRLQLKAVLLDTNLWNRNRDLNFGIALIGDLSFPTGNADNFMGSRYPRFQLRFVGSMSYKRFAMSLNFGGMFQESYALLSNLQTGHGLTFGFGVQGEVVRKPSWSMFLVGEVFGMSHYPFQNIVQTPAEVSLALKFTTKVGVDVFIGGGPGINGGYGVPDGRAYIGFSYLWHKKKNMLHVFPPAPPAKPPVEPKTVCANLTGPDGKKYSEIPDGYALLPDGSCKAIVCKGMKDADGKPLVEVPADYVQFSDGSCKAIVCKGMKDADGKPLVEVPADYVQFSDGLCKAIVCRNMKNPDGKPLLEIPSGYFMNDKGECAKPPERRRIKISTNIFFLFNQAQIKPESHSVLNEVIAAMIAGGEKMKVRIDGHTDSRGGDVFNIDLSNRRSNEVMRYLTGELPGTEPYASKHGQSTFVLKYGPKKGKKMPVRPDFYIASSQLSSLGFGKTCPVEAGESDKARQVNRRVEFVVIDDENGQPTNAIERCDISKMDQILKSSPRITRTKTSRRR